MNRMAIAFWSFVALIFLYSCNTDSQKESITDSYEKSAVEKGWKHRDSVYNIIKAPLFPDRKFVVTDFGAKGDSITDCTLAFRNAIDSCHNLGGGTIEVPAGVFITGAIHLKSNINLFISKGAKIQFSDDKSKYLPVVLTRFEGMDCYNYSPLFYAFEQENIAITGQGVVDGNGETWWALKGKWGGSVDHGWQEGMNDQKNDVLALNQMVATNIPVSQRIFGDGHYLRSSFIQPYNCKNVLIEGITINNAPMWIIHPVLCENVIVRNLYIESLGPNNDGCDPECSRNVLIDSCFFNTGDDCIAIKSGRNNDGRRVGVASENIIVQNCTMVEGHGGVVMGSEISGDVRYVFAENCIMDSPNLDRAFRIKSNSLRGGVIEHLYARNVEIKQVKEAVLKVNFFYSDDTGPNIPVTRHIYLDNIRSYKSEYAVWIKAYPEMPVSDVYLSNCTFNNVEKGVFVENANPIKVENVTVNGQSVSNDYFLSK